MDRTLPATKTVTFSVVVKKCLISALKHDLPSVVRDHFLNAVNDITELVSILSRRASLCFLFHVTYAKENGIPLPDFDKVPDAYWKQWMRIGLIEFYDQTPSNDAHVRLTFDKIKHLVGSSLRDDQIGFHKSVPEYFDRALGHSAIQFKTSVKNLLTVNFFAKLERLCKYVANKDPDIAVSKYTLFNALRKNNTPSNWSSDVREFIQSVRSQLHLKPDEELFDDTEIDMVTRVNFHWWMQQKFETLEERKIRMTPVTKVMRSHVRLDATMLHALSWRSIKQDDTDAPKKPERIKCPLKRDFDSIEEYSNAMKLYNAYKVHATTYETETKEYKKKWDEKFPSISDMWSSNPKDPITEICREHKLTPIGKRPSGVDKEVWQKQIEPVKQINEQVLARRKMAMDTDEFKERIVKYTEYENKMHSFAINTLFKPFDDKKQKLGWKPAASIATDGVSVSILYEKIVRVPVTSEDEKKNRRRTRKQDDGLTPCDDYDPYRNTMVGDVLVLGIDPGRTQIVTIVCIDAKNKKHVWKLSRGQYYTDGVILRENRRQIKRYKQIEKSFETLTASGGCVKASKSLQVFNYIEAYSKIQKEWWLIALKRVELRSKISRYMGKRKVLDSFFSRVRKEANELCGKQGTIQVAYGSAAKTMPSTGRGEVAAPVGDAYKTCARIFKGQTSAEDENYSTKVNWETKKTKELTYVGIREGKAVLCHSKGKRPPVVKEEDKGTVTRMLQESKERGKRRRSWNVGSKMVGDNCFAKKEKIKKEKKDKEMRYIECRGLRFCPEMRKYYDRDASSARAIAGLRCLRLRGLGRPSVFTRAGHGK